MELRRKRAPSPPKPSRLQPSEPLHMTTRAASKAGSNASESRRGSLVSNGQISPVKEDDGERYPKRRRISVASKTTPTRASQSSQSLSTASRPSTRSMSGGNLPRIDETPSFNKKRKRSLDTLPDTISVASAHPVMKKEPESRESAAQSPPNTKKPFPGKTKRLSTSSRDEPKRSLRSSDANSDDARIALNSANETHEHDSLIADAARPEGPTDEHMDDAMNGVYSSPENTSGYAGNGFPADSEVKRHQSPTKRNSSIVASDASRGSGDVITDSFNDASVQQDGDAEEENEEDADGDDEVEMSQEVTTSREMAPSTFDPTPVGSAQASPAGSPPDSSMDQESPVKRAVTSVPGDAGLTEDGAGIKGKKKLPGRRRAPHANPKVEAALRRQLHLRINYRAVAKALKPILAELGQRSLSNLGNNPKAHEQSSEYPGVKEGLHQHFEGRLAWVQRQKDLNKKILKDQFEAQLEMRRSQFDNVARNIQEMHIVRLQHDFLTAVRDHEHQEDDNASDDENQDVIPPLRHATARGNVTHILGPEYHWRSRPAIETERLFEELHQRHELIHEQQGHDQQLDSDERKPFTTFDTTIRDGFQAAKMVELLVQALVETQKVSVPPPPPTIANSDATKLQALANASAASAAIDTAMREAEEKAKVQEEAVAKFGKEEELARPSPLSVPKTSLSQPPEDSRTAPSTRVPTPAEMTRTETKWPVEGSGPSDPQPPISQPTSQPQSQLQPLPTSRPATTFSQVALGPSLTETAPPTRTPVTSTQYAPHPIIPGLTFYPQPVQQIPGLSSSLSSILNRTQPTPSASIRDPPAADEAASRTPSTAHTNPVAVTNTPSGPDEQRRSEDMYHFEQQRRSEEQRGHEQRRDAEDQSRLERRASIRPQDGLYDHSRTPSGSSVQHKSTGKDFWSSLARGATENGSSKVRLAPRGASTNEFGPDSPSEAHTRAADTTTPHASDNRPYERQTHPLARHSERPLEDHPLGPRSNQSREQSQDRYQDRAQEYHQDRRQDRPLEHPLGGSSNSQDKASSRLPSITSATAYEPHSQKRRSNADAFGPLLERLGATDDRNKAPKKRGPKSSLYGPWPRSRNHDDRERRASAASVGSQEGAPDMYSRTAGVYGTPDHRHASYHTPTHSQPPPPFGVSGPPQGAYLPPHAQYAPVPPPYGYDPRTAPYQHSPYGPPTGFSSLPGPPPMSQPPPNAYYAGPQPPYPPPQTAYPPHQAPLAARPPVSQPPYGPQYGGQPILPANPGPGGYGQNGSSHGSPASAHAGPAFAQYSHRDEGRRHDYGRGRGRHSGGHSEWKHYQGPR